MSQCFAAPGDQHDTKNVKFEFLLHAAFMEDEIWGETLNQLVNRFFRYTILSSDATRIC